MNKIKTVLFVIFPLLLVLSGCENTPKVDSNVVASKDIVAYIDVVHTGENSVYIETRLSTDIADSEAYINLVGDDKLVATLSGLLLQEPINTDVFTNLNKISKNEKQLLKGRAVREFNSFLFGSGFIVDGVWYFTYFNNAALNSSVQIAFHRAQGEPSLYSEVKLPTSFDISSPSEENIVSRSGDIEVSWSPVSVKELLTVSASAQCANEQTMSWQSQFATNDLGFVSIPSETFQGLTGECNIRILVERVSLGKLDSRFKSGRIVGRQQRAITLATVE